MPLITKNIASSYIKAAKLRSVLGHITIMSYHIYVYSHMMKITIIIK